MGVKHRLRFRLQNLLHVDPMENLHYFKAIADKIYLSYTGKWGPVAIHLHPDRITVISGANAFKEIEALLSKEEKGIIHFDITDNVYNIA